MKICFEICTQICSYFILVHTSSRPKCDAIKQNESEVVLSYRDTKGVDGL